MSLSRSRIPLCLAVVLATLGVASPAARALAEEVAPPAADETLIYVLRAGRFFGGGVQVWVAVNGETVARLANKGYALVRAKAGEITLNLAQQGVVLAATAVDDRPGQTVYLQWRIGDPGFAELDAAKGSEIVSTTEQGKPIDKTLGNNERLQALVSLGRLGFDVMRPAPARLSPDAEHAVLTFFRKDQDKQFHIGVWGEDRYLGTLEVDEGVEVALAPGEHYFLSGNVGTTLLKTKVEAGKHYYAVVDVGSMVYRVRLEPVTRKDSAQLNDSLALVKFVQVDPDKMTPRTRGRETTATSLVRDAAERARTGKTDFTEIGADNAF